MSLTSITHSFGHIATHNLAGFASQVDRKRRWLETRQCASCFRIQSQAEAKRTADNAMLGLSPPPIQGGDRQIDWALRLRAERVIAIRTAHDATTQYALIERLFEITDAKTWIDQRTMPLADLLESRNRASC